MKPKDLKFPYSWEKRYPVIVDQVFYIPDFYDNYDQFSFPALFDLFGNHNPVVIEYGAGNGSWSIEKAQNSLKNWIVIEKRFERVQQIWSKMKNRNLKNFFIICGKAEIFTQYYLKPNSVEEIFINFPDPWPKDRHAKHRLFQIPFIDDIVHRLISQGMITIVTDDPDYKDQIWEKLSSHEALKSSFPEPGFITHWEGYGSSYFDALWREKGKTIHYFQFKKQ